MIGIFDSGVGGLSVLKAVRARMPHADILYFGDTLNAPYGLRSQAELSRLTAHAIILLRTQGAEHIVSACNSVSASLVSSLFDVLAFTPRDLIEMVGPTVAQFKDSSDRIALCATPATINAGIYQNAFALLGKEVLCIPIADLAGAIETGKSEEEVEHIIREALEGKCDDRDVLILACTHYPLVRKVFERVLGDAVRVFDPSEGVAERAYELFDTEREGNGTTRFLISKETEQFNTLAAGVCAPGTYTIEIV